MTIYFSNSITITSSDQYLIEEGITSISRHRDGQSLEPLEWTLTVESIADHSRLSSGDQNALTFTATVAKKRPSRVSSESNSTSELKNQSQVSKPTADKSELVPGQGNFPPAEEKRNLSHKNSTATATFPRVNVSSNKSDIVVSKVSSDPLSRKSKHSSVLSGEQSGADAGKTDSWQSNDSRRQQKKHTVWHLFTERESESCKFYDSALECDKHLDKLYGDRLLQWLTSETNRKANSDNAITVEPIAISTFECDTTSANFSESATLTVTSKNESTLYFANDEPSVTTTTAAANTTAVAVGANMSEDIVPQHMKVPEFRLFVKDYLKGIESPSSFKFWKHCLDKKMFGLLQYGEEGLLIHSCLNPMNTGSVIKDYLDIESGQIIGTGGFGIVYRYNSPSTGKQLAIKKEIKDPLIAGEEKLFQRILSLKNEHVVEMLEYVVGPILDNGHRSYLSVMHRVNKGSLNEQLKAAKGCKCILDYMEPSKSKNNDKLIFRNFLILFLHIFKGMFYLNENSIIHRDIKTSNILVDQKCLCESPLQCVCPGEGGVCYLLADMNLFCNEGDVSRKQWVKMVRHDPAGTIGMKAPETFYSSDKGRPLYSHKSDVWSGCVTMMDALSVRETNKDPQDKIGRFLKAVSESVGYTSRGIDQSCQILEDIMNQFTALSDEEKQKDEDRNLVAILQALLPKLHNLKELIGGGSANLHRIRSFQGEIDEIYKEQSPLASILTTVYAANNLPYTCLKRLVHIYHSPLWGIMNDALGIIAMGTCFMPEDRPDAKEVVVDLEKYIQNFHNYC